MSPDEARKVAERTVFAALPDGYLREIDRGEISNSELHHDPEHEERGRRQCHLEPPAYVRKKGEARSSQSGLYDLTTILVARSEDRTR